MTVPNMDPRLIQGTEQICSLMLESGLQSLGIHIAHEGVLYTLSVNTIPISAVQNSAAPPPLVTLPDGTLPPSTPSLQYCGKRTIDGLRCLKRRGHVGACSARHS